MYQIIIVDDEPRILEGLINLFPWNNFNFNVQASFLNGRDALDYINSHDDIDVVMTDIQMPVMDGIELARNLRDSDIIVVFFSAYQDFEYARSAIINHVVDYLIKPMRYDAMMALFDRITAELERRHQSRSATQPAAPAPADSQLIATVKQYLEDNYATASLEEAAMLVHYSTTYLSTTFKEECGVSFSRYLQRIRMEHTLELLNDRHVKIYEIADAVGYLNPKNLTRNFKDYYGITPQEYRAGKPLNPIHPTEDTTDL